jgi:hypothetical protein
MSRLGSKLRGRCSPPIAARRRRRVRLWVLGLGMVGVLSGITPLTPAAPASAAAVSCYDNGVAGHRFKVCIHRSGDDVWADAYADSEWWNGRTYRDCIVELWVYNPYQPWNGWAEFSWRSEPWCDGHDLFTDRFSSSFLRRHGTQRYGACLEAHEFLPLATGGTYRTTVRRCAPSVTAWW